MSTGQPAEPGTSKRCPHCASDIPADAVICRHCRRDTRIDAAEWDRRTAAAAAATASAAASESAAWAWGLGLFVLIVIGAVIWVALATNECNALGGTFYKNAAGVWGCWRR